MQLNEQDPWDRILARKADEAPVMVAQRERDKRTGLIAIGIGLLIGALLFQPTRAKESK